jgi:parallel beta-helix repeat protein
MLRPGQSTVVQTGGIAGIHETHTINGYFVLTVDFAASVAWFDRVDANLSESIYLPTQSLEELFQMTELVSTEVNETVVEFEDTNPPLGGVDIGIRVTFENDLVRMTGQRTEPWPDSFVYDLDAMAWKWADVDISPARPATDDVVHITLSGIWGDSCIPYDSSAAVIGNDIYYDVIGPNDPNIVCSAVPTPWELTESVGPLSAGTYTVYARIVGYPFIPDMYMWMAEFTVSCLVYYVDGVSGSDDNDGLTLETAFATIQKGVDEANDAHTVLVYPAVYTEPVNFDGKAITVQGVATEVGVPIVETPNDYAFSFFTEEEPDSALKNFVVRNSYLAALVIDASPAISNLTIVDNRFGIEAYAGSQPYISNCIFHNNTKGDLSGCEAKYSFIREETTEGLVAHWKFDEVVGETAYDSAGNNDGTIYGAVPAAGQIDGAFDFDGVDDYVSIANDSSLNPTSQIGISVWVKATDWTAGHRRIIQKGVSDNQYRFYVLAESLTLDLSGVLCGGISTCLPSLNEWHHLVGTYNGSEISIFIDGQQAALQATSGSINVTADELNIGVSRPGIAPAGDHFAGLIDDARIYDRGLSGEDVEQIYLMGLGPGFADANGGDYHLLSERGRYWPEHDVWVLDEATSSCVDGGDPNDYPADERMPNGGGINMGVYGGTGYASMSEWAMTGDVSKDGIVNFKDIAIVAGQWLDRFGWAE